MKKIKNLCTKRDGLYFRYKVNGKDSYISLQLTTTARYIKKLTRRNDVADLVPFVKSGEMTQDELLQQLRWYEHKGDSLPNTIQYYLDKYMEHKSVKDRPSTVRRNICSIRAIGKLMNLNKHIEDFGLDFIEAFEKKRRFKVSTSALNIDLRFLSSFSSWLVDHEYIPKKVKIKQHKAPKQPAKYISEDNFKRLINEKSIPSWIRNAAKIYWSTGCRKMELITGTIRGLNLVVASAKSKNHSEFNIPLEDWMIPIIKAVHQKRDEHLANGYKLENFTAISDKIIDGYKILGIYEKGRTKLHSLRHSFGCRMYLITADTQQVQLMMNHETDAATKGYITFNKDDLLRDFPTTAKNSRFLDNMERVKKDQSDILEYLDVA
jgi:integrase